MGAYLNTSGKIFLGSLAIQVGTKIIEKMIAKSDDEESDNEYTSNAWELKAALVADDVETFTEIIDQNFAGCPNVERRKMWLKFGGNNIYLPIL